MDGDGFDDFTIGDPRAAAGALGNAGAVYVIYGRDFTGTVAVESDGSGDTLIGTGADEGIIGGAGSDFLDGARGIDVLRGGAGNDRLVWDPLDRRVDGGAGIDTLLLNASGVSLDLTQVGGERVTAIEALDLTGSGNNQLVLDIRSLLAVVEDMTVSVNGSLPVARGTVLRIDGDVGDNVIFTDAAQWTPVSSAIIDGTAYNVAGFTNSESTLTGFVFLELGVGSNLPVV
ncbi:MAG: hypothetical protein K2Y51_24835 [Gammaproteobacteria bacterium]|nr:hypothetical protein [Gammaproteobacteria bacterium]